MPSFPIQLKRNGTAAATPSSLLHGEVALNYADGKLFWKDASNVIQSFTFQAYALSSHTHAASDITSGTLDAARLPLATTIAAGAVIVGTGLGVSSGTVSVTYGTSAGTACQGNDSRLSDARTPTSHSHGNITNAGAIGSTANLPVITTTSGVLTTGSFGTTAATFCEGNDSRLSDTRTPTDGSVTTAKIADDAVTYAKLQNVSTTDRLLGRSSAGSGDVEEVTCTAFGRSLIDDADAAAARTTLSVQPTASPAFTGGPSIINSGASDNSTIRYGNASADWYVGLRGDTSNVFAITDASSFRLTISTTGVSTFSGSVVINNDGNVVPLTVTNTGTANSFVVNDASGDTTPFVIDASGNVGVGTSSPAAALDVGSGNLRFSSTAQRITGDFSNSTISNRLMFQTSTSNGNTSVRCIPNGTATVSNFVAHNGFDSNNTSFIALQASLTETIVNSGATGTGTYLPLTFYTNNAPQVQISTSGQLLVTAGSASACGVAFSGDANTGMFSPSADVLAWATNGSERFRVASNGDAQVGGVNVVGLRYFDVRNTDSTLNSGAIMRLITRNAANTTDTSVDLLRYNTGLFVIANNDNGPIALNTGGSERVRVDASGNVGINDDADKRLYFLAAGTSYVLNSSGGAAILFDKVGSSHEIAFETHNFGASHAERMRIGATGTITAPQVYSDTVGATNRDLFIDDTGKLGYVSSIRASKTNIDAIDDVSWLRDLKPVSFHYRRKDDEGNYTDDPDGTLDYGLIAEDVEPIAPEMCFYDVVDGEPQLRGVHYSKLITPMLRYVQQLEARIAALEERLNHA